MTKTFCDRCEKVTAGEGFVTLENPCRNCESWFSFQVPVPFFRGDQRIAPSADIRHPSFLRSLLGDHPRVDAYMFTCPNCGNSRENYLNANYGWLRSDGRSLFVSKSRFKECPIFLGSKDYIDTSMG